MAVNVTTDAGLVPGRPRVLFEAPPLADVFAFRFAERSMAATADGERVILLTDEPARDAEPHALRIVVVTHWFQELEGIVAPQD